MIEAHLPLVRSIARRYVGRGEPLEDLVQVGTIGLIKAVDRFDPARGRKLSALARPSIESEIRHHLRDRSSVLRVPRTDRGSARPRGRRRDGRRAHRRAVRLSADRAAAPDDADATEARLLLDARRGRAGRDDRERRLLHLRYVEDRSQAEIATELGLSQAHVSRLLRAALEHVRGEIEGEPPPDAPASAGRPARAAGGCCCGSRSRCTASWPRRPSARASRSTPSSPARWRARSGGRTPRAPRRARAGSPAAGCCSSTRS